MNMREIAIHSQRVIDELSALDSHIARTAINYCNTPHGRIHLHQCVKSCSDYSTIADLTIEITRDIIANGVTIPEPETECPTCGKAY